MKSEPNTFSIDDLRTSPKKITHWDGVRNYQARNFMRDDMKKQDLVFFYHSNCETPGIVGIMKVVGESYPDFTAFDPKSNYYDSKSDPRNPRWFMVDVQFVKKFSHTISLQTLKQQPELAAMPLVRKGNRLSIMPVTAKEWQTILTMV